MASKNALKRRKREGEREKRLIDKGFIVSSLNRFERFDSNLKWPKSPKIVSECSLLFFFVTRSP